MVAVGTAVSASMMLVSGHAFRVLLLVLLLSLVAGLLVAFMLGRSLTVRQYTCSPGPSARSGTTARRRSRP